MSSIGGVGGGSIGGLGGGGIGGVGGGGRGGPGVGGSGGRGGGGGGGVGGGEGWGGGGGESRGGVGGGGTAASGAVVGMTGVDVVRGETYLLRGIDWAVEADQRWVVLGPNGAGKTTLLALAAAIMHPT